MEQLLPELLRQGAMGLVAGIFLWLYLTERSEHKQTRKEKDALMEARRVDATQTLEKVEEPLRSIASSTQFIADKLVTAKRQRG